MIAISTVPAGAALHVSSVSPVWTWVGQGKLVFRPADGWVKITRRSVEKLLDDPALQEELEYEAELARILAPFDATDEDITEMYEWYEPDPSRARE